MAPSPVPPNNGANRVWELYNLNADFNERINLAEKNPAKLKELQAAFEKTAEANNVYPFLNWTDTYNRARALACRRSAVIESGPREGSVIVGEGP